MQHSLLSHQGFSLCALRTRPSTGRRATFRAPLVCPHHNRETLPVRGRAPSSCCSSAADDNSSYTVKAISSTEDLQREREWLSLAIRTWLDEEWTVLPEHQQLGEAAAEAYIALRSSGEGDMGNIVLSMASTLLTSFNFRPTFTDAFEVSNKVAEMVMMREGCDVCCTTDEDKQRLYRIEQQLS